MSNMKITEQFVIHDAPPPPLQSGTYQNVQVPTVLLKYQQNHVKNQTDLFDITYKTWKFIVTVSGQLKFIFSSKELQSFKSKNMPLVGSPCVAHRGWF